MAVINLGHVLEATEVGPWEHVLLRMRFFSNNDHRDLCWRVLGLQLRIRLKSKNEEGRGEFLNFLFSLCPCSAVKAP